MHGVVSAVARTSSRAQDRVQRYFEVIAHRCTGCGSRFEGPEAFLGFVRHLDLSVACRHRFEEYLDAVRDDHAGGD